MKKYILLMLMGAIIVFSSGCKKEPVSGCTNPSAENYNPDAEEDDGLCLIRGCTDPEADNYNPEANVDSGDCIITGCLDPDAINYNPNANNDGGDCKYPNDRFIGEWSGALMCTNPLITGFLGEGFSTILVTEIEGEKEKVLIQLGDGDMAEPTEATINGNLLTFENNITGIEIDIDMDGEPNALGIAVEGNLTINDTDDEMTGTVDIMVSTDTPLGTITIIEDTCDATITRN